MVAGNWLDPDGLYRQYGTQKLSPRLVVIISHTVLTVCLKSSSISLL